MNKIIASILSCITLIGCNQDDANNEYSLKKLQSVEEGEVFSIELTGVDSSSRNFSGSVRMVNGPQEELNGVLVYPKRYYLNITDEDLPTIFPFFPDFTMPLSSVYVLDENGLLLSIYENTGDYCVNTSPDKLPDYVKIGDAGALSPLQCLSNVMRYRDWKIFAHGEERAMVSITTTHRDQNDSVLSLDVKSFIINKPGNVVGFEMERDVSANSYQSRVYLYSQ